MKKLLILSALAIMSSSTVWTQSSGRSRAEDIGEDFSRTIKEFVDDLAKQFAQSPIEDFDDTTRTKRKRTADIEDLESADNSTVYSSPTTIEDTVIFTGNIVMKGADLTVAGKVEGDVLVIGANLYVRKNGVVAGNARVINGSIIKDEGGVIEGFEDRTGGEYASHREPRMRFRSRPTTFDVPWLTEPRSFQDGLIRFNRVEGLFLGLGSDKKYYWDGQKRVAAFGSVGYGFKAHTWRGNLGLGWQFPLGESNDHRMLEMGVEGYSLTDSKDQWMIGLTENTLAAFFIHEDFRDYFEREGFSVHGAYYMEQGDAKAEAKLIYKIDRYASLVNRLDWALFGGDKRFRENPAIDPGRMRSFTASFGFSTSTRTSSGPEGWNITGSAEVAKETFGSDFDFEQYIVDVRRFQPLGAYESINMRLRAGTTGGAIPLQKTFNLGGLGTVPAYSHMYEIGNRLLLVNTELIVNGKIFDDIDFWPTWLFRHFNFLIQSDAGLIRAVSPNAGPTEGFRDMTWNEFRHDFGFGFANRSGSFRIGATWRTDKKESARFLLRIERPF